MSKSIAQTQVPADGRGHALVTIDGRYHVVERIAAGGMGEVYRAHDAVLAREVAIKVLHRSLAADAGFVDRFRREARAAATLNHQHIVAVYDWGAVDGIYYMVMEYVHGRSTRELLNAEHHLAAAQACEVVRQTLLALEHAHAKGIVHRDLKPENILLTPEGVVKLTDLGLARAFADARATHAGAVTGTVQYLAPEQIRGEPADPRSDLYSLGIVTYELLTGRLPFDGETPMAIAYKHLSDAVPPPSAAIDVPAELDAFVAAAVDKDREMRPESASVMRRDLEAFVPTLPKARSLGAVVQELPEVERADEPTVAGLATITETIPRVERTKRRRGHRVVGLVLFLAMVAAAAWGVWTYAIPHTTPVPAVDGMTVAAARDELTALGFSVTLADGRYDRQVPDGSVLDVDPAAGTELGVGETVTLVPSLGPPPTPVPRVVGDTQAQAVTALEEAGFAIVVKQAYHPTAPVGEVVRQRPLGDEAPFGSKVTVWVSKGHAPVAVPKVIGDTQSQAEKTLRRLGFAVAVVEAFSDDVPRGEVMDVSPAQGDDAPFESTVTITVSQGPENFAMPRLIGMSSDTAEQAAEALGLTVSIFDVPGTSTGLVIGQDPGAGATVRQGDAITLFVA